MTPKACANKGRITCGCVADAIISRDLLLANLYARWPESLILRNLYHPLGKPGESGDVGLRAIDLEPTGALE